MERHFDEELNELKTRLLLMGGHAESVIHKAIDALKTRDSGLAAVRSSPQPRQRFMSGVSSPWHAAQVLGCTRSTNALNSRTVTLPSCSVSASPFRARMMIAVSRPFF